MKNTSRHQYVVRVIAVFIFIYIYDWLLYGKLLAGFYAQTAELWRAPADMMRLWPVCLFIHIGLACVITSLYSRYVQFSAPRDTKKIPDESLTLRTQSLFFGISLGLLLGLPQVFAYVMMPIPAALAVCWLVGGLAEGILASFILYYIKAQRDIG